MYQFNILASKYLQQNILAFYHADYVGHLQPGNPDYINTLKNTYNNCPEPKLNIAKQELEKVLLEDLPQVFQILQLNSLTVCVVPRAKAEANYQPDQLLFKSTIRDVVNRLNGFYDGTNYIIRHTNTRTTHLPASTPNYNNDGQMPCPGITTHTCYISNNVQGRDILLIDDLYTRTVNIDEDAIQALLRNGARSVTLYTVGRKLN